MAKLITAAMVLFLGACKGSNGIYIWNGTENAAEVNVSGGHEETFLLNGGSGRHVAELGGGHYLVKTKTQSGGESVVAVDLDRDQLSLVNVDGAGCFARSDVRARYKGGKEPDIVLQTYAARPDWLIADIISILPGEPLPPQKPKNEFPFQRLSVVPCAMINSESEVSAYLRKQR